MNAIATLLLAVALAGLTQGAVVRPDTIFDPVKNITLRKLAKPASLSRALVPDYYVSDYRVCKFCLFVPI